MATNNSCRLGLFQGGAGALDFGEDRGAFRLPRVGARVLVALVEIGLDVAHQLRHRAEAARTDHVCGQVGEEALDEVHPGRRGRREVGLEARMAGEPRLDLGMLVGGVVVLDQVDVETLGRLAVDLLQEAQPFDVRVALLRARDQLAFERIERREQVTVPWRL